MNEPLSPESTIGRVALNVADLKRSLAFYQDALGFHLHEQGQQEALLGSGERSLLRLREQPGARQPGRATAGLYHFALLLPNRAALARAIRHLAQTGVTVQGFADHYVSEAVYLADPDGNGIELYRDRPRGQWPYRGSQLQIGTAALDLDDLLAELGQREPGWSGVPPGTTVGHVHLQVSDLEAAENFYREVVGFDLIMHYGNAAAFLSAGGYHHHLGLNTWAGAGIPKQPPHALGIRWYEILTPQPSLDALLQRARRAGFSPDRREDGWLLQDPSGISLRLTPDSFRQKEKRLQ